MQSKPSDTGSMTLEEIYTTRSYTIRWTGQDPYPDEPWSTRVDGTEHESGYLMACRDYADEIVSIDGRDREMFERDNEPGLACVHFGLMC